MCFTEVIKALFTLKNPAAVIVGGLEVTAINASI